MSVLSGHVDDYLRLLVGITEVSPDSITEIPHP